jgi:hypothetical protein
MRPAPDLTTILRRDIASADVGASADSLMTSLGAWNPNPGRFRLAEGTGTGGSPHQVHPLPRCDAPRPIRCRSTDGVPRNQHNDIPKAVRRRGAHLKKLTSCSCWAPQGQFASAPRQFVSRPLPHILRGLSHTCHCELGSQTGGAVARWCPSSRVPPLPLCPSRDRLPLHGHVLSPGQRSI